MATLAHRTGLPRSSAHRIATALCAIGYLQLDDERGVFTFGPAFDELVRLSLVSDVRLRAFRPAMEHLLEALGETTFLARRVNGGIEIASILTPRIGTRSHIYPGVGRRPLDKCSSSKAILAWTPAEEVKALFESEGLANLDGPAWTLPSFIAMLRGVQERGFAVCDGEIDEGICSYAVPVQVGSIAALFSLGVVGPAARLKTLPEHRLVGALQQAADLAAQSLFANGGAEQRGD